MKMEQKQNNQESQSHDSHTSMTDQRLLSAVVRQCKDIPDKPIMVFLLKHRGKWCNWYFGDERDVSQVMPTGIPEKLVLAKMRMLVRRGLVKGCSCGCRGDFEITEKGEEWLCQ